MLQQCYHCYISSVFERRDSFTLSHVRNAKVLSWTGMSTSTVCLCQQSEKLTLKHLDLYKFCKMFIVYALKPVTFLLESSEGYVDQK